PILDALTELTGILPFELDTAALVTDLDTAAAELRSARRFVGGGDACSGKMALDAAGQALQAAQTMMTEVVLSARELLPPVGDDGDVREEDSIVALLEFVGDRIAALATRSGA